jgi:hypothetical protein
MSLTHAIVLAGGRHANFKKEPELLNLTVATILRDPIEKFKSAYNYSGWLTDTNINDVPHPMECIGLQDGHFARQAWFLEGVRPDIYGDLSAENGMEKFTKKINLPYPLPWENPAGPDRFEQHRTPELEKAIIDYYAEDYLLRSLRL